MQISCNLLCFNEADIIRFTIKHYQKFCSSITIWDNYSTDNSCEIAKSMGCEVKQFGKAGQLHDGEYLTLKNHAWKSQRTDLIIFCDMDEILIAPPTELGNFTIWPMEGFNMFSEDPPKENWEEINMGIVDNNYAKHIIFSPRIKDINFRPGAHQCDPRFPVWGKEKLRVCHFKHAAGIQRVLDRNHLFEKRKSKYNRDHQFGIQYGFSDQSVIEYFNSSLQNSKRLW